MNPRCFYDWKPSADKIKNFNYRNNWFSSVSKAQTTVVSVEQDILQGNINEQILFLFFKIIITFNLNKFEIFRALLYIPASVGKGNNFDTSRHHFIGNFSHSLDFFWSDPVQGGLISDHKDSPHPLLRPHIWPPAFRT